MTDKFYDVVVLGRSIGALAAAALLARRDFRVLVLGNGAPAPSYRLAHHVLRRSAFTMLCASSPIWRKVLLELAQLQTFRRRAVALDPMVQVLTPGCRLELPTDMPLFEREIEREFPLVRRALAEIYSELTQLNSAADEVFEQDAVWPPGTFWERRKAARQASRLLYARDPGHEMLADLPANHPYRQLALALVSFGTHLRFEKQPAFAFGRLHGAWTRGLYCLPRGEDELVEFLLERIQAHGGTCRLKERVAKILVDRGGASAVAIDGEPNPTGTGFVISDGTGEQLAELTEGEGILKSATREWPKMSPSLGRFVVSVVVRSQGLPERLGREAILMPKAGPPLHLVRMSPADEPEAHPEAVNEAMLVVETLIPLPASSARFSSAPSTDSGTRTHLALERAVASSAPRTAVAPVDLTNARERILDILKSFFPFLDCHLVLVDSPHDGRPVWRYAPQRTAGAEATSLRGAATSREEVDRLELAGGSVGPEPMTCQWDAEPIGYLNLVGEPVRGPIGRTFLVGPTVLPALGQEGELLSAWSAARIITRADLHKERIRRAMWRRVEIG